MEPLTADDPQAIGGFRLQARLEAGAMGWVYLATSPAGRRVAVKVLQPELARDQEFIRRFRAEIAAARLVGGIYMASVVEAGVDDVPPWLTTAFVPGRRLMTLSRGSGRCRSRHYGGWPRGPPTRCAPSTPSAWCTETSSPATCCWPMTGRASSTLASPAGGRPGHRGRHGLLHRQRRCPAGRQRINR